MKTQTDIHQRVTDAIISSIETGAAKFANRWIGVDTVPTRITGDRYQGINAFTLGLLAWAKGYSHGTWMTYNQAKELGGQVRKGETAAPVVFYKQSVREVETATGETEEQFSRLLRGYAVFNVAQIDGLPEKFTATAATDLPAKERNAAAEAALRSCGATITEDGGNTAYYRPSTDSVHLPALDVFFTTDDYLATMAHELAHWTGGKARLNRDQCGQFGSARYAEEELVAEIGSAFICARLNIAGNHIDSHAGYVESWLKTLKTDKKAIFRAASAAQLAADMVLANAEGAN